MTLLEENLSLACGFWYLQVCHFCRRQRQNSIFLAIFQLASLLASLQLSQLYEYFLYYDTLNLIRGLCKVSGDLQITGIMGVTVLYYAVPRVFMLVRLVCGHWNQESISFWLVASISM